MSYSDGKLQLYREPSQDHSHRGRWSTRCKWWLNETSAHRPVVTRNVPWVHTRGSERFPWCRRGDNEGSATGRSRTRHKTDLPDRSAAYPASKCAVQRGDCGRVPNPHMQAHAASRVCAAHETPLHAACFACELMRTPQGNKVNYNCTRTLCTGLYQSLPVLAAHAFFVH